MDQIPHDEMDFNTETARKPGLVNDAWMEKRSSKDGLSNGGEFNGDEYHGIPIRKKITV